MSKATGSATTSATSATFAISPRTIRNGRSPGPWTGSSTSWWRASSPFNRPARSVRARSLRSDRLRDSISTSQPAAKHSSADQNEPGGICHVPTEQAPRLPRQPVEPLQSNRLHPPRRPPASARDQVEDAPHADGDGHRRKLVPMQVDPALLLGVSEGHQQNVGPRLGNPRHDFRVVHFLDRGARRLVRSRDHDAGIQLAEARTGSGGDTVLASKQEQSSARVRQLADQRRHEVSSRNPTMHLNAEHPGQPDDGSAVRKVQVGAPENAHESWITLRANEKIEVHGQNLEKSSATDRGLQPRNRFRQVDGGVEQSRIPPGSCGPHNAPQAVSHHMEPTALPAQALPKLACPCRGSGAGDMGGGRETYADAGQAQVDGVLEILDAGERAPRVGLEGGPAEQHAVANQVGAHAKPSATREANSMEQQEPGCDELGSSRAQLAREHRAVGL